MAANLDLAEEEHVKFATHIAVYQQQLLSSYNKRAKIQLFQPRDLVPEKQIPHFVTTWTRADRLKFDVPSRSRIIQFVLQFLPFSRF